jgi:nucleoside-diphosphate-sugar epimerase
VYGPGQNSNFIIPNILNQVLAGESVTLKDPRPRRDYIHIDDLVSACIIATKNISKFKILNVGSGVSYGIIDIIHILENYTENKIEIINKNINRKNEIFDIIADISYTKLLLNWEPKIKFENGIINMFHELKKIKENGN